MRRRDNACYKSCDFCPSAGSSELCCNNICRSAAGGDGGVTPTTHSGSMAQLVSMAGVVHITIHSLQPGYVPLPGMHWWYLQTCVPATSHQLLHHSAL